MEITNQALAEIESGIRLLKIDFDRFFNGALPAPPEDQRRHLAQLLRRARATPPKSFADRFLLNTLEARFNTLSELFNRRIRELETGGPVRIDRPRPTVDPRHGVVLGAKLEAEAVTALYQQLYNTSGRRAKTDFDSFRAYLGKQVEALQQRTGCRAIRFRVDESNGQPTLKAKPLNAKKQGAENPPRRQVD